jgi:hypothetical protein
LRSVGFLLGGLVAGEGCFTISRRRQVFAADGSPRLRFVFQVVLAERDRALLFALQSFLGGVGRLYDIPPEKEHWLPKVGFHVGAARDHHRVTIPFAEQFLLPTAKRRQFQRWRDALVEYETNRPTQYGRGPSTCSQPGCGRPVRGRGVCRVHYYQLTGY